MVFFLTLLMILECILCGIKKLFIPNIKFLMIFFFFFFKERQSKQYTRGDYLGWSRHCFIQCLPVLHFSVWDRARYDPGWVNHTHRQDPSGHHPEECDNAAAGCGG